MASPLIPEFRGARRRLVETLQDNGISDLVVLRAFEQTPRHLFVPSGVRHRAYEDSALPIGSGQTISQPSVHARYLQLEQVSKQFVEVLMAPDFAPEALQVFAGKANVRLLKIALPPGGASAWDKGQNLMDIKRVGSGLLMQTSDIREVTRDELKVVTKKQPTPEQLQDLLFAWKVAKYVKSNAIVFCKDGMTMGVGAGQMSRLDSARIASIKAQHAKLSLQGTAVASDAFFPFRDGLDVVVDAGATCVIQPGGSMRDQEVIAAANERGVAMVFSGVRHFRH